MASPVVVKFQVDGIDAVQKAFKTVEDAVVRGERTISTSLAQGARERIRTSQRETQERSRDFDKLIRETERWQRQQVRDHEKAERDKTRQAQREGKEREKQQEQEARNVARLQRDALREYERTEREKSRVALRAEQERTRAAQQAAQDRARFAQTIAGAGMSGARAGFSRIGGIASSVAGTALQLGGGFAIADALHSQMELQRSAALLSNSAYIPGTNSRADVDPARIMARAKSASIATGLDPNDLVKATRDYVAKSSDFKGGMANMEFFGRLAKATGTDLGDVTKTAGILRVQNKNLGEKEMKQLLLDTVMQGKQGAVEFEDLARVAGKVTRTSASYAGSQTDNQRKLLGLSQIAIRTAGSPSEAATVLANLSSDALKHSKEVGKVVGKDFLNEKGQIAKGPEGFIADVMEKTGGNMQKIMGMGFGARSIKIFQALSDTFNEAESAAGGGEAGRKAGRKAIEDDMKSVTGATYTDKELGEDFKNVMNTPAEQFEAALRSLKVEIGSQLLPEFVKLVPVIKDMVPSFVDLTKTALPAFVDLIKSIAEFANQNRELIHDLAAHPIGTIMMAEVTKSIAAAALGEGIKKVLATALGSSGGIAVGAASLAIASAVLAIDKMASDDEKMVNQGADSLIGATNSISNLRHGDISPEQIKAAKQQEAALKASIADREKNKGGSTFYTMAAMAGASIADTATLGAAGATDAVADAQKQRKASDEKQIEAQKAQLASLTAAIKEAESAMKSMAKTAHGTAVDGNPARGAAMGSDKRGGTQ